MADPREKQRLNLLHYWLLDYACHNAFLELMENKYVSSTDFIQGVLLLPQENLNAKIQVNLLLVMCKLSNGEDYNSRYVPSSDLTVLEEVLTSFDAVNKSFEKQSSIRKNSAKYRLAIMKQAVYVCCRAGDFDTANAVFERQWSDLEDEEKSQRSSVQAVIKSKKPDHKMLRTHTYKAFIDQMVTFLKEIADTLPEPFLLKVARAYTDVREGRDEDEPTPRKKRRINHQKVPSVELSPTEEENLMEKVHKIQKKTVNDLVTMAVGDSNNSNIADVRESGKRADSNGAIAEIESRHGSRSPASLADTVKETRINLKNKTKNLKKTVTSVKASVNEDSESSSKEESPPKRAQRGTPQKESPKRALRGTPQKESQTKKTPRKTPQKSPKTNRSPAQKSPRTRTHAGTLQKSPKAGRSEDTVSDSPGKDIRNYQYKKNRNRPDRHRADLNLADESDSVDISDDDSTHEESPGKNLHLRHRPKLRRSLDIDGGGSRYVKTVGRKRVFWTEKEEEDFYLAVKFHGVGNWSEMRSDLKTFRTSVHLKDKWRQILKSGKLKTFEEKFGTV